MYLSLVGIWTADLRCAKQMRYQVSYPAWMDKSSTELQTSQPGLVSKLTKLSILLGKSAEKLFYYSWFKFLAILSSTRANKVWGNGI